MSVIGDNIRALRKLNGEMTQQALADAIGVTRETVNKWEMGSIGNVRTSNVDALRSIFGLSVDDLRSESRGLAARQSDLTAADVGRSRIPVLHLADLMGKTLRTDATCFVDISPALFDRHPRAFALFIDGPSMNSILPEGCHAIVDPETNPAQDSVVVSDIGASLPVIRRLHRGATKAMLSEDSLTDHGEDFVLDINQVHVIGTVVWYQPAAELT